MGISVFLKEKRYPFLLALTVLFVCVTLLLLTNCTLYPLYLSSDLRSSSPSQPLPSNPILSTAMVALTTAMCWKVVAKSFDSTGIGLVIYQKPDSTSCYSERRNPDPPVCDPKEKKSGSWYVPLSRCLSQLPGYSWPVPWPERLSSKPLSLSPEPGSEENFYKDTKDWSALVLNSYLNIAAINWSSVRNVMDMNAGYGGFAAALIDQPLWVTNVIPVHVPDTLPIIFDRGLIGFYHDW